MSKYNPVPNVIFVDEAMLDGRFVSLDIYRTRAKEIATLYHASLGRHCAAIEIVGWLRRGDKPEATIELVAAPHETTNLFGESVPLESELINTCSRLFGYSRPRVSMVRGKREVRFVTEGFDITLYLSTQNRFGYDVFTRTGPRKFVNRVLARKTSAKSGEDEVVFRDGCLWVNNSQLGQLQLVLGRTEEEVFAAAGVAYVPPFMRTEEARIVRAPVQKVVKR